MKLMFQQPSLYFIQKTMLGIFSVFYDINPFKILFSGDGLV